MKGSEQTIAQLLSSTDGQKAFLDWLSSPITQALLDSAGDRVKPLDAPTITAEQGLYQLGIIVGGERVLSYLRNPLYEMELRESVRKLKDLPTYGSDKILEKEGRKV